eukprot:1632798-Prymnesium_polylepis.1
MTRDVEEMRVFVRNMETQLKLTNENDLSELKEVVEALLEDWEQKLQEDRHLEWNPHVGANAMLANLEMIVEQMWQLPLARKSGGPGHPTTSRQASRQAIRQPHVRP